MHTVNFKFCSDNLLLIINKVTLIKFFVAEFNTTLLVVEILMICLFERLEYTNDITSFRASYFLYLAILCTKLAMFLLGFLFT